MYSGYILVFGFITTIDIVSSIFEIEYYDDEFRDNINGIFENKGYKFINLIYQKCCYHRVYEVFLAVELGNVSVIYRNNIEKFNDFQHYENDIQSELDEIKEYYLENETEILKEFKKFSTEYNLDCIFTKPEFYKIANDCESCT